MGQKGLKDTTDFLDQEGIAYLGAGANRNLASKPLRLDTPTNKIGILAAFDEREQYRSEFQFYASKSKPGALSLKSQKLKVRIQELKSEGRFVILFPHWGQDYCPKNPKQEKNAKILLEAGADLIMGHGAHLAQEITKQDGKWVFYGLGNSVFLTPGRYEKQKAPPFSIIVLLSIESEGLSFKAYPIVSDNRLTGYSPRPVTEEEFQDARQQIDPFGILKAAGDDLGFYLGSLL
jgi:UDP-N-acetylmuramoyl-tripeptide--D-alanyl-D-alanine ligase/cyanophycin synthetase/poly-gamma-glutamate synthesis protein (capsule biosynthesis protein)